MRNALVFMALMFGLADVGNASYELRLDCSGKDHEGKKYTLEGSYIVAMQPGANTVEIGNWIKLNGSVRQAQALAFSQRPYLYQFTGEDFTLKLDALLAGELGINGRIVEVHCRK